VSVNTSVYPGDINTSDVVFDPPPELQGKINVVPEMHDVIGLAILNAGGELCTTDMEILRQVRDTLMAAKQHWLSMDYDSEAKLSPTTSWPPPPGTAPPCARASTTRPCSSAIPRRLPVWMDSVALLSDAQNVDEAYEFLNFIMAPENAAMISNYARYGNGIAGSEEFMDPEMPTRPEIVIPEEHRANGRSSHLLARGNDIYSQIWTELQT
jgi:spermidine/putrescine transport system substrate-binding protein